MACDFCRNSDYHSANPCPVCGPADHSGNTKLRKAHKPAPRVPRKPIPGAVYVIDGGPLRPVGQAPVPGTNSRAKYTPPPPVRQSTVDAWAKQAMPAIGAAVAAWDASKAPTPGTNSRARYTPPPAPPLTPQQRADVDAIKARMMADAKPPDFTSAQRAAWDARQATPSNPTPPPSIVAQRPAQAARVGKLTPVGPFDWHAAGQIARDYLRAKARPQLVDSTCRVVDDERTQPPISRGDFKGLWIAVEAGVLTEAAAIELAASWRASSGVRQ